jgi:pimeloyl-ACP methyl ester carboxylesterase
MVALSTHNTVELPDGRRLGYAEYGHSNGSPILFFHGVPGSRLSGLLAGVLAAPLGGRVIAIDRPGYGLSDFHPRRHLADWPADVSAFAKALGLDRFAVFGHSGGGPYAAATAYALPERVTSAAIVSGMGPVTTREAWRQMTPRQRFTRFVARRAALVRMAMAQTAGQITTDAEAYLIGRDGITPEVDLEVLRRPTIRAMLKEDLQEAFAQGAGAAAYDIGLLARPWGFALEQIRVPVHIWHGERDRIVPVWLGRQVAAAIPNSHARFIRDAGHMLFVDRMDDILGTLVERTPPAVAHPSHRRARMLSAAALMGG